MPGVSWGSLRFSWQGDAAVGHFSGNEELQVFVLSLWMATFFVV